MGEVEEEENKYDRQTESRKPKKRQRIQLGLQLVSSMWGSNPLVINDIVALHFEF